MTPLDQPILLVATKEPQRARAFYEDVLGLSFVSDEPWALVFDVGSTMLRIQKVEHLSQIPYTVFGWRVNNIRKTMSELLQRGVQFEQYEQLHQDERGVWETPDGTKVCWFRDPDSNTLSLTQH
jgi:catechol 2,3-dioxygenase-like lactoylglutathione lyase family enzyme